MSKRTTTLRLAKTPNQWTEIDETIQRLVRAICARYDDEEQVRSFLTLLDMMTNPKYEASDREMVAFEAEREAFRWAPECAQAQESYMGKLVMPTQEKKTA